MLVVTTVERGEVKDRGRWAEEAGHVVHGLKTARREDGEEDDGFGVGVYDRVDVRVLTVKCGVDLAFDVAAWSGGGVYGVGIGYVVSHYVRGGRGDEGGCEVAGHEE